VKKSPIVVIGAGLGGLAVAISLASKGYSVTILEKNEKAGGKLDEAFLGEFRFDIGPSLLTMKFVLEDLFHMQGKKLENYLTISPIDPICQYFYPSGLRLNAYANIQQMIDELPESLKTEAQSIQKYLAYSKNIYDLTADLFLFDSIQNFKHLLNPKAWKTLLNLKSIDPFRTVHKANQSFFQSAELIQLFDRYATYNGSDPFQAPATLNIIPHVEYTLGSWYVKGGMYRLGEALVKLALESGVTTHYNTPVQEICIENGGVSGIKLGSAEVIKTSVVVSNADVVYTHSNLIKGYPSLSKKWEQKEPSCSGLVFLWAMNQSYPELSHHNIFFSEDYQKEFKQIFQEKKAPVDPTIYLSITSKSDPDHAPIGKENWFILVNMPWLEDGEENSEAEINLIRQAILARLKQAGFANIQEQIIQEKILSPSYLRSRTFSNKGSIYGLSSNHRNAAFYRQDNKSRQIKGLYFAGGSAHPGGGIPLVILSGMNAARHIEKDSQ
jgi:phytoene desaturase